MEDEENGECLSGLQEKLPDQIIAPPVAKDAPDGMFAFIIYTRVITCHVG